MMFKLYNFGKKILVIVSITHALLLLYDTCSSAFRERGRCAVLTLYFLVKKYQILLSSLNEIHQILLMVFAVYLPLFKISRYVRGILAKLKRKTTGTKPDSCTSSFCLKLNFAEQISW